MDTPAPSSYGEVVADYDTYSRYFVTKSVDDCQRFIIACRRLLRTPSTDQVGGAAGTMTQFNLTILKQELDDAMKFLAALQTAGRSRFIPMSYGGPR